MSAKIKMIVMALLAILNVTVCAQNIRIDKVEVRGREIKEGVDNRGRILYDLGPIFCGGNMENRDICKMVVSNISSKELKLNIQAGGAVFFLGESQKRYSRTLRPGEQTAISFVGKMENQHPLQNCCIQIIVMELGNEEERTPFMAWVNYYGLSDNRQMAFIERDGKWGAIDINQKTVIPFEYEGLEKCGSNIKAQRTGKWGLIDKSNKVLIPFEYDDIKEHGYYFSAKKNDKWGIITEKNKVLIPFEYDDFGLYWPDCTMVKKDGRYGAVDKDNHIVIPFEYEMLSTFSKQGKGYAVAKKNNNWGGIDNRNHIVVPFNYDDVEDSAKVFGLFGTGTTTVRVKKNGKWGKIDENNKVVTPFIYDKASDVK